MIANKHITKIIAGLMALAVCLCVCAVGFSGQISTLADPGVTMAYESALFDTDEILEINIRMDESDWQDMLDNAISEEYYVCDVELGGKTFYQVGIRPKGNTSLSSIANDPTTDRYSFKLEFDHYVDGQSCFGLDKLILNNNYADATNMKEALIYDMYQYLGADASLYNYAKISVNGEYCGVYLALEAVEDSFLLRNYGVSAGALYKPEGMDMGGGHGNGKEGGMPQMPEGFEFPENFELPEDFELPEGFEMPEGFELPEGFQKGDAPQAPGEASEEAAPDAPGEDPQTAFRQKPDDTDMRKPDDAKGGFGFGSGGANLNYTDDELDSYETIWDGAVTKTKKSDRKRVVTALKNIAEGNDLEAYMDTDNLLRYAAVHIFSVNEDSLSGAMAHNYYLYEADGRLNLLPWDYNLAFGGMSGGSDASSVVNSAIDDAWSSTTFFDALLEDELWHSQYYAYLQQLAEDYIQGGAFDAFYTRVRGQLDALVEADPTAFYSYEEYLTAADTLYQLVQLRGTSILGQVSGTIPATKDAQRDSAALVDASGLDISVMGSMNMGGGRGFDAPRGEQNGAQGGKPDNVQGNGQHGTHTGTPGDTQSPPDMPDMSSNENAQPPDAPEGGHFDGAQMPPDMPAQEASQKTAPADGRGCFAMQKHRNL